MTVALTLVAIVAVVAVIYGGIVVLLAREFVYPRRARPTRVMQIPSSSQVVLSRNAVTGFEGTIGLLYDNETRLAVLASGARSTGDGDGIVRELVTHAELMPNSLSRACGNVFRPDEATGVAPASVDVGLQPAWLFEGSGPSRQIWVVHVHGMLAGRDSALRGVHAVADTGVTSLVISYPGDHEAEQERPQPSMLGEGEWHAVDAAIDYARSHGAESVFLLGWSLGATIAMNATRRGVNRGLVQGLVLVSPTVSWAATIRYGMAQRHIPAVVASSVVFALRSRVLSRTLRLPSALELPDALPAPIVPTLLIHSRGDRTTPFESSFALAAASDLVDLVEFGACPHALEWNADPERFSHEVRSWVTTHM